MRLSKQTFEAVRGGAIALLLSILSGNNVYATSESLVIHNAASTRGTMSFTIWPFARAYEFYEVVNNAFMGSKFRSHFIRSSA